jgi:hypothetical protein
MHQFMKIIRNKLTGKLNQSKELKVYICSSDGLKITNG